jgi:hypothetical protein
MPRRVPGAKRTQAEAEPGVSHVLKDQQVMTLLGVSWTGLHYLMRKPGLPLLTQTPFLNGSGVSQSIKIACFSTVGCNQ